jgi:hypothetical protein
MTSDPGNEPTDDVRRRIVGAARAMGHELGEAVVRQLAAEVCRRMIIRWAWAFTQRGALDSPDVQCRAAAALTALEREVVERHLALPHPARPARRVEERDRHV